MTGETDRPLLSKPTELRLLEKKIGYTFRNADLLEQALTHSSFSNEAKGHSPEDTPQDYEGLEFLGDAILGFLISEHLFRTLPSRTEGELSKIRSFLVSTNHLASLSQELDLGAFLRVGCGEEKTGGRYKKAILADLFESLMAAIYLDGGWEPTRQFLFSRFKEPLEDITNQTRNFQDPKSRLQEELHRRSLKEPTYRVVEETGPDHSKSFVVGVCSQDQVLAQAGGKSKKEAEQKAAERALQVLDKVPD